MPDDLIRRIEEVKKEMSKELGKVNDQMRAREKLYEIDTRTQQGRKEMLDLARKEVSMFNRSEHFEKMIGALDMTYDQFVDHEMKYLNGRTPEGRSELATLAGIERREFGETERFRQMLDKGKITQAAFEYFDKNGELPGMKKNLSFKGGADRQRGEETHNPREMKEAQARQEALAERREAQAKERELANAARDAQRREDRLKEAYSAMKRGDAGQVREILAGAQLTQRDLMSYARMADRGEIRRDSSSPSFGSLQSDAYYKTSELKRDLAAGREVAVHNRVNELNDIGKKMVKEEQAKLEKKKQEELEKQKKAEQKKAAEKKAEEARRKKAEEERKKREAEEKKRKEAEEKRKKEEAERKKNQK